MEARIATITTGIITSINVKPLRRRENESFFIQRAR
jgi:hypothetical protein